MKHSRFGNFYPRTLVWARVGGVLLAGGLVSTVGVLSASGAMRSGSPAGVVATPTLNSTESTSSVQTKQSQPDQLPIPLAIVRLDSSTLDIRMINASGAELNYQVIGDTDFRLLNAQSDITLQDLSIPTTITFRRSDGGLLTPTIEVNNSEGTLTLILQPTEDFASDRTALRIEPTGAVYLN